MHNRGEGICQKGLLWSQKHSAACEMMGEKNGCEGKESKCRSGVTLLTLGVTKR